MTSVRTVLSTTTTNLVMPTCVAVPLRRHHDDKSLTRSGEGPLYFEQQPTNRIHPPPADQTDLNKDQDAKEVPKIILRGEITSQAVSTYSGARLNTDGSLEAEDDEGSVEYKWRLTNISSSRFEHLKTQMKFRVTEGQGQCLYEIGVSDNGTPKGLPPAEFDESVMTVRRLAQSLGFEVRLAHERTTQESPVWLRCAELVVTKTLSGSDLKDLRVSFCGSTESGKSTLVSVLVHGALDDGTGTVRQGMFNHKHEIDTGRTSSVSHRVLGFDETGRVTNYDDEECGKSNTNSVSSIYGGATLSSAENTTRTIAERSVKLVTLMDLGGDCRYTKTAYLGMTSRVPGYACVCVAVDAVASDTEQYVTLCSAMRIPFLLVLTKVDTVSELEVDDALFELSTILSNHHSLNTLRVEDKAGVQEAVRCLSMPSASSEGTGSPSEGISPSGRSPSCVSERMRSQATVPIFAVSSVEGTGISLLKDLFHLLPIPSTSALASPCGTSSASTATEVLLDHTMRVPAVGTVLCGHVAKGSIALGDSLMIGPDRKGNFFPISVCGIHVKGSHVSMASAGLEVTISIGQHTAIPPTFYLGRKGSVLVDPNSVPNACLEFEMMVEVLTVATVTLHQEPVVHCRNVRQAAKIISIVGDEAGALTESDCLRHRQKGTMRCRFLFHAEVLDVGSIVLLRCNQHAKLIGTVTRVFGISPTASPALRPASDFPAQSQRSAELE